MTKVLVVILWLVSGWFVYRGWMSHFQRKFRDIAKDNYLSDKTGAFLFAAITGPFGLISLALYGFYDYGIKAVPPPGERDEQTF